MKIISQTREKFKKTLVVFWPLFFLLALALILFWPFLSQGKIPLPADIALGAYHPFKDVVWEGREAGFPVKNLTIFDPIRQMYPWRYLAMEKIKAGEWPLWNPYEFAGTPLLAQIFTASLYPLNLIFFLFDFNSGWGWLIFTQPLMAVFFAFFYLKNLKLQPLSALLGGVVFAFSSFLMMRLEWGIVGHTAAWLPLVLLCVDKLADKLSFKWFLVFVLGLSFSFLGGYLQASVYIYLFTFFYFAFRWWGIRKKKTAKTKLVFLLFGLFLSLGLSGVQLLPLAELLSFSRRLVNPEAVFRYFLPFRHLISFLAPDFFGNPATGNYWGADNYTEFCGYVGIFTLFLVGLTFLKKGWEKTVRFYQLVSGMALVLVLPHPLSYLLYQSKIPLFSNLTPSRWLFLINFCLSVLAAFGLNEILKEKSWPKLKKLISRGMVFLISLFVLLFLVFLIGFFNWPAWHDHALVSLRNLVLPFFYLLVSLFFLALLLAVGKKKGQKAILFCLLLLLSFDLIRQAKKYNPFIKPELIFPETKIIQHLQEEKEPFRFQKTDVELFPGNFQVYYHLQAIDGYDSFFSQKFAKVASVGNTLGLENLGEEFERVIFLGNHHSPVLAALNTKYVLSLRDLSDQPHLKLIMEEGKTRLYENLEAFPRAYLVKEFLVAKEEKEALSLLLKEDLKKTAVLEKEVALDLRPEEEEIREEVSLSYPSGNQVSAKVLAPGPRLLVLSESYFPGWQVKVDGQARELLKVNYHFKGVLVPKGEHLVEFSYHPLSFKIGLGLSLGTLIVLGLGGILVYRYRKELW